MSEAEIPPRVINTRQIDRLIEATKEVFDGWLERVVKNGPSDLTAATELAACSARYDQLMTLRRGYLDS
jgi:hypothetical protein